MTCEKLEQVACGMGHVVAMTTAGGLLRWGVEAGLETLDAELQALPLEGEQSGDNQLALLSVPKHSQQCPFGSAPAWLLRLLRARLVALVISQPVPRVRELAASKAADRTAFGYPGAQVGRPQHTAATRRDRLRAGTLLRLTLTLALPLTPTPDPYP